MKGVLLVLCLIMVLASCTTEKVLDEGPVSTADGSAQITIIENTDCGTYTQGDTQESSVESCFAQNFAQCHPAHKVMKSLSGDVTMEIDSDCRVRLRTVTSESESQFVCANAYIMDARVEFGPDTSCEPFK